MQKTFKDSIRIVAYRVPYNLPLEEQVTAECLELPITLRAPRAEDAFLRMVASAVEYLQAVHHEQGRAYSPADMHVWDLLNPGVAPSKVIDKQVAHYIVEFRCYDRTDTVLGESSVLDVE